MSCLFAFVDFIMRSDIKKDDLRFGQDDAKDNAVGLSEAYGSASSAIKSSADPRVHRPALNSVSAVATRAAVRSSFISCAGIATIETPFGA